MQSDSPPEAGATPDSRSLTDRWRDLKAADTACPVNDFHRLPVEHKAYLEAVGRFYGQLEDVRNQATIRAHAVLEHPHLPWDEQAAVFTTGRFEGRAR